VRRSRPILLLLAVTSLMTPAADLLADEHGAPTASAEEHAAPAAEAKAESAAPPVEPLPVTSLEEASKQPFGLVRTLQSVQDQIAGGSGAAKAFERDFMARLNVDMRGFPPAVWDDARNARAAVIFVLSGGDPKLINDLLSRSTPPPIDPRLLKATLAFGENRPEDAIRLFDEIDVRTLDPGVAGLVALIEATLLAKKERKKAIARLDEARLLAPGTLIEESALRQEILLVAREGNMERFDELSEQYSRRFANSIYAANFRRQFFAGVARQDFAGRSEWISRTETELGKLAPQERTAAYLSIAEEATLGGNAEIARYAAGKASALTVVGSAENTRAMLYEGAALVLTDDLEQGVTILKSVPKESLRASDIEIQSAAGEVAQHIRAWPVAPAESSEPLPASVTRAQEIMAKADSLLEGGTP